MRVTLDGPYFEKRDDAVPDRRQDVECEHPLGEWGMFMSQVAVP